MRSKTAPYWISHRIGESAEFEGNLASLLLSNECTCEAMNLSLKILHHSILWEGQALYSRNLELKMRVRLSLMGTFRVGRLMLLACDNVI